MDLAEAVDLEAEYDNRARVPEHPAIMAGWERDASSYRAARRNRAELGLVYGTHPRQTLDIFHPDDPDPGRPLVVFIHGGYWRRLDPGLFSHLAAGPNGHGIAVAMPGYRLCPEATLPEIIEDIRLACRFLHGRLGRRLVVCGHSAGGHLAAAMTATNWREAGADAPADLVRHGLSVSGIFDLRPLLATSVNGSLRLDERTAERASPALWPAPRDVQLELWVGELETSEYARQSHLLAERWGAGGALTQVRQVANANHFTAPAPLADPESAMTKALVGLCETAAHRSLASGRAVWRRAAALDPRRTLP